VGRAKRPLVLIAESRHGGPQTGPLQDSTFLCAVRGRPARSGQPYREGTSSGRRIGKTQPVAGHPRTGHPIPAPTPRANNERESMCSHEAPTERQLVQHPVPLGLVRTSRVRCRTRGRSSTHRASWHRSGNRSVSFGLPWRKGALRAGQRVGFDDSLHVNTDARQAPPIEMSAPAPMRNIVRRHYFLVVIWLMVCAPRAKTTRVRAGARQCAGVSFALIADQQGHIVGLAQQS
jgi:hypothetical protein